MGVKNRAKVNEEGLGTAQLSLKWLLKFTQASEDGFTTSLDKSQC